MQRFSPSLAISLDLQTYLLMDTYLLFNLLPIPIDINFEWFGLGVGFGIGMMPS